jgi:hypothetical protein
MCAADTNLIEGFEEALMEAAACGERGGLAGPGQGASASGQSQLWADWRRMSPKAKVAFINDLTQALAWSGQDAEWGRIRGKVGRQGGKSKGWKELSEGQRGQLLWALDGMTWEWVEEVVQVSDLKGGALCCSK